MAKAAKLMELQSLQKQIKEQVDTLRAELLEITREQGVVSLKTEQYTISRVSKLTPHVENFALLKSSLDMANIPYDTVEVFDDTMGLVFRQLAKEGREMPGLAVSESEYIMIRIAGEKK